MRLDEEVEDSFNGHRVAPTRSAAAFGRFARVPFGAIRDARISFAILRVLVALSERAHRIGSCYPSVKAIAEDSRCLERQSSERSGSWKAPVISPPFAAGW
jgi:hypothetical protein